MKSFDTRFLMRLAALSADDTEMVSASNCARLEELSMHTSHEYDFNAAPWHGGPLRSWSVTDCPLIRRISMDSRHVGGLLPDLLRNYGSNYPRKYEYEGYMDEDNRPHSRVRRTHANGYYESDEPG